MCQRNAMDAAEMNRLLGPGWTEALGGPAGVFDLSSAKGVNESERLLMRLCRELFLSLWVHANLHTVQDMGDGRAVRKNSPMCWWYSATT